MKWWCLALGAAGFFAGRGWPGQEPDRHWVARNGADWRRMGDTEQTAYVEGFLAGAAFGQAAEQAADSAGLTEAMARLRRSGGVPVPLRQQRLREPDQRLLLVGKPPPVANLVRVLGGERSPH